MHATKFRTRARDLLGGLLASVILLPSAALAQGPSINTDTPIMLGLEGRGVRTFLKVVRKDQLLQDGVEITDPKNRTITAYITPIVVPYNLLPTLQLGAIVPFVSKQLESTANDTSRSGLGDMTIFVKKLLLQVDRKAETFRIAVKGSAKLPTGSTDTPLALGTGSFDYGASAVAGWIKSRWGLYGEGIYFHNTADGSVDYGDRFGYNIAIGFRAIPVVYERYPSPQLNLSLELNGITFKRTKVDDAENANSGGTVVFLSPGVQYVGGRRWLVEASVQLPIVDEPNGTQLGTNWTASLGTRILLF